ncbi:MAG TPA: DUF3551 domain-containing protein [Xanthobacteraceae bacterium]|jgi:hypothetical protein|nr:DUF3551 domain-containing protein [Xanthobacteraceae bacterium]
MRLALLLCGTAIAAAFGCLSGAFAQTARVYPWCAVYARGETNCGFETWAQCEAARSGNGGRCYENPAFYWRESRPLAPHDGPR